ncbi:MAG: hypothetical protein AAF514_20095, partial [Verrucomicrobiota bacterium]
MPETYEDVAIQKMSQAEALLAQISTPNEAASVADVAAAAAVFAKRVGAALPIINRAMEIKLAAERKAGEM